ncbi:MAG TPA: SDR family oxidoreductase [Polyangia bacterium]|nr:SDR family oxidoreductase [Polyangia bacterium]
MNGASPGGAPTPASSMAGRICLVTGATSGIGRETALGLAERGATVILAGRDATRGRDAVAEIGRRTGRRDVELLVADLSSQAEVRRLAAELRARHDRLHVLVNNAAVITPKRSTTIDGLETQLAVNHLAPFLLTNLLLDVLKAGAPARIVNVASQVEGMAVLDFDDLGREKGRYERLDAYYQSKHANMLFTFELARRLAGTGVTANCLHPGVIGTNLLVAFEGRPAPLRFLTRRGRPGPKEGAATSLFVATSPTLEGVSGRYFRDSAEARSSPRSLDAAVAARLWEVSEKLTGLGPRAP